MLERLVIRDLVLVEWADVEFGPGLNVVTGETGAGKSLLVQAVDLLTGGRADPGVVREGARAAVVEGEFRPSARAALRVGPLLAAWGIECDGESLIVRREVMAGGKSRALVNQSAVTRGALRELCEALADLHGQHEHQSLLRPGAGLETLDRLATLDGERGRYAQALAAWRAAAARLETIEDSLATHAERREWLEQTVRELDQARLRAGEEDELRIEAARLAHADRLRELVGQALARLADGEAPAVDAIARAGRALEQAAALDPSLAESLPALEAARIATAEVARELGDYASRLEADPAALEQVESRRETIARLARKHRRDVPALIAWHEEIGRELASGEDSAAALTHARGAAQETHASCLAAARALSGRRQAAAQEWGIKLSKEMKPLGLQHASLGFVVEPDDGTQPVFGPNGLDQVEIMFSANAGEPARPLQKVVSGGELSRVMLALKVALEAQDPVDLLLFDEVDSGIGGAVAQAVGERLKRLACHRQVVCVTHLPMIAALADHHLRVDKSVAAGRTVARIAAIEGSERVEELARMLAGDRVTDTTRRQARELLGDWHVTSGRDHPVTPGCAEFRALAAGGRQVPVYCDVPADHETPVSAFRKLDDGVHSFLLESLEGGEKWGRFSVLGSRPTLVFRARGERCEIIEEGVTHPCAGSPLDELRALLATREAVTLPGLPRFCGGAVGILGGGAARWFVGRPAKAPIEPGLPDAVFLLTDVVTVFDHVAHTVKVVTHARGGDDSDAAWAAAVGRLDAEIARLEAPLAWPAPSIAAPLGQPASSFTPERFASAVERARAHIRAGEVLQLTLARRLSVAVEVSAFEVYRALRLAAPSPYSHFLRLGDFCLAGSAPGSLVRRADDVIEAHILAGTRPRGRSAEEEHRLADQLRTAERERAAHALSVDVARSDLGWVAEPGTVDTGEWMEVERHSQAMHLSSSVRARPRPDAGPLDLLRTCFPAGTDCGLPRARTLELIEELEPVARGVHHGAVGYFDHRGGLDLCSSARTLVLTEGRADWNAEAVIAADTDSEAAWRATEDQSRGAALALQRAAGAVR